MAESERGRLETTLAELCTAVGADDGASLYLEGGDGALHLAASSGHRGKPPSFFSLLRGHRGAADRGTLFLTVPGGGVVVLSRRSADNFTQQDATVAGLYLRRLADDPALVGGAGRSSWTRQLEAIQRIAARLTRLATVEEVGTTICNETRQVIDYDEAHVFVVDAAGRLSPVAAAGIVAGRAARSIDLSAGPGADAIVRAARSGVGVLATQLPDLGPDRKGPYSMLIVPLHYEGRVSGVICLAARGGHRFDDDDLRLLQVLSDQAAVAIENARLMMGSDKLVSELASLLEFSQAAGAATDETQLARLLAARMLRATRTDVCLVSRWDEASTMLRELLRDGLDGAQSTAQAWAVRDVADSPARRAVLRDGRPLIIQAWSESETAPEALQVRAVGGQTLILVPLNAGGRTVGLIELLSLAEPRQPDDAEMQACEAMASLAATGLEKARLLEQLRSAADMDLVTSVHNHRYLQERLRQEVARSLRSHSPLAVLMLDLDKFKPINDRHGHAEGDRVLHNVGAVIRANVRTNDVVARYGGDEFVVLMPDTRADQAEVVSERVVSGIRHAGHQLSDDSRVSVGVSAGLAVFPTDGKTSAQLLQAADAAMYLAKRTGGGQVERSNSRAETIEIVPAPAAG